MTMKTNALCFLMLILVGSAKATVSQWQINPTHSTIRFTATQNNAPISGQFSNISGDIKFDPKQLQESSAKIEVDMNSVKLPFKELEEALKMSDWFDIKDFPKAVFKSKQFNQSSDKVYQIVGDLTIRNKTLPMTVDFNLEDFSEKGFHAKGETHIKRSDFGVGQGEWADLNEVKDEVKIEFNLQGDKTLKIAD